MQDTAVRRKLLKTLCCISKADVYKRQVQTPNGNEILNEDNNLVQEENNTTPQGDGKKDKEDVKGTEDVEDNKTALGGKDKASADYTAWYIRCV